MMQQILLGLGGGGSVNVDDVFDILDYTGNGSSNRTLTTALDLSSGNNWFYGKRYSVGSINWAGVDTVRGAGKNASLNNSNQEENDTQGVKEFNNGNVKIGSIEKVNHDGFDHIAYLFKGAQNFFDVVTYSGNGTAGRTISHALNAEPGMIIIKALNQNRTVRVYHTAMGNTKAMAISHDYAADTNSSYFNNTSPTSSVFTVGNDNDVNATGTNYVAYLFAKETDNVIKCGGYAGNGTLNNGPTVTLGFQPQWIMIKAVDTTGQNWNIHDSERGFTSSVGATDGKIIRANLSSPEATGRTLVVTSTGFQIMDSSNEHNDAQSDYIYMAIAAGS